MDLKTVGPVLNGKQLRDAGGGLVDEQAARIIISRGPVLVAHLAGMGVVLEGAGSGVAGIEGGHSRRRVLHLDDRTGRFISETLSGLCRLRDNIEIVEAHHQGRPVGHIMAPEGLPAPKTGSITFFKEHVFVPF